VIDIEIFILLVLVFLVVDVLTITTRSAYLYPNVSRLLAYATQEQQKTQLAIRISVSIPRLKAGISFLLLLNWMLLAGLIIVFLDQHSQGLSTYALAGILTGVALLLFLINWVLDGLVSHKPEMWAMRLAPYAQAILWIMFPLSLLPASWFAHLRDQPDGAMNILADELKTLVDAGEQEGVLELGEGKMISSIFDMGNTLAREIMVPRIDMLAMEVGASIQEAIEAFLDTGHSRVPVFEDTVDNVVGLLYAKDLLGVEQNENVSTSLKGLLRPAYFIPEAKRVNELLTELQVQRIHMAIVVDEYGGVAGLVTLEDIVEEILGEIQDEYDQAEESPYQQISEDEYIFLGKIDLDDLNDMLECQIPKEDAETLGGYIYSQIGRVPTGGESLRFGEWELHVEQVIGRRIHKVRVQRISSENDNDDEEVISNGIG
jgi:putative hemolysin